MGAGAAGVTAALAARGALDARGRLGVPGAGAPWVLLLDGQARVGRKILVSGGGRCNVTNASVRDRDFETGAPAVLRGVLAGFPPSSVRALFEARGVALHEEPVGKLFPDAGGARAVLAALLGALEEAGVERAFGEEVGEVAREGPGWRAGGRVAARVVVATGGLSMPATGSTGFGYALAERLGHRLVPPLPALTPLRAEVPRSLAGITLPAVLTLSDGEGRVLARTGGSLLFTHRGVSGPAALDLSLAVERRSRDGGPFVVRADLWSPADPRGPFGPWRDFPKAPGSCLPDPPAPADPSAVEREVLAAARAAPRRTLGSLLGERLPRRLVEALVPAAETPLARLSREDRRRAAEGVAALDLRVAGTEGLARAEVTAGGVDLRELDRVTLESRLAPGVHFCGEVCDVTGRLGGFNFQWAWSSGFAAGRGAAGPRG